MRKLPLYCYRINEKITTHTLHEDKAKTPFKIMVRLIADKNMMISPVDDDTYQTHSVDVDEADVSLWHEVPIDWSLFA